MLKSNTLKSLTYLYYMLIDFQTKWLKPYPRKGSNKYFETPLDGSGFWWLSLIGLKL